MKAQKSLHKDKTRRLDGCWADAKDKRRETMRGREWESQSCVIALAENVKNIKQSFLWYARTFECESSEQQDE